MKKFEELNEAQQQKAVEHFTSRLLEAICEGAIRFNDALNQDDLQARIDAAGEKMHHRPDLAGDEPASGLRSAA